MPKQKKSKNSKSKIKVVSSGNQKLKFNKLTTIILILIIAAIGSYFLFRSFAASNTSYNLTAPPIGIAASGSTTGYWIAASDGGVFAQGTAVFHGSIAATAITTQVVSISPTQDRGGYYLVGSDGAVYAFGDAKYAGGVNTIPHPGSIVGIAAHNGGGYWVITNTGATYAFGGAPAFGYNPTGFSGSIVGIAPDAAGTGYYAVSSYGQVYALGGAAGCGNAPAGVTDIVGVTASSSGSGCWLVGADGGVFSYGSAAFYGSMGNTTIVGHAVGIASSSDGKGYWVQASDGGVFSFGDAAFEGRVTYPPSTASLRASSANIVAGQSTTLTWSTTNTQSVSVSGVVSNSSTVNGNASVSPRTTTTYVLSAVGDGGNSSSQVTITVTQPPPPPPKPVASSSGSSGSSSSSNTPSGGGANYGPNGNLSCDETNAYLFTLDTSSSGSCVSYLNLLLEEDGWSAAGTAFDGNTLAGVHTAQSECGIAVDGIVGPQTWQCVSYLAAYAIAPVTNSSVNLSNSINNQPASSTGNNVVVANPNQCASYAGGRKCE